MEFAVLPDTGPSTGLLDALGAAGLEVIATHHSGRPWLLSDERDGWRLSEPDGRVRVAVSGERRSSGRGVEAVTGMNGRDLDRLAESIATDSFFLATMMGETRTQGTLSTDKQVFWSIVDGTPVAANTLSLLYRLTSPQIDDTALVLSLIKSLPIQPFSGRTPWQSIHAVGIGNWLKVDGSSSVEQVRWWRDPGRDLSPADAAPVVRRALYSAVEDATDDNALVSSDLSGGLDSTSICFVLRDIGQDFVTYRTSSLSSSNDETDRARRIARDLEIPLQEFAPLAESSSAFDLDVEPNRRSLLEGPLVWAASRRYLESLAPAIVQDGSHTHFTGLGGDELFDLVPGLFRSVWRENKLRAYALIRHLQLGQRVDPRPMLRSAISRESYADYLARTARVVAGDEEAQAADAYSWFPPVTLPAWFSDTAREIAIAEFRRIASHPPTELGDDPAAQQATESVAFQGKILRQFGEQFGEFGIDWRAPFTDARVVRAVLRAPAAARFDKSLDKPLLAAAVGTAAPAGFYMKRGRSDFTSDVYAEHRRRRRTLVGDLETSLLVERGLIDQATLISIVYEPPSADIGLLDVERIVTAERWLRGVHEMTSTA